MNQVVLLRPTESPIVFVQQLGRGLRKADDNDFVVILDFIANYKNLKYKLGRIPNLMDFDRYGEMDVLRIFDNNSLGSYYKFLVKYEKDYKVRLLSIHCKWIISG